MAFKPIPTEALPLVNASTEVGAVTANTASQSASLMQSITPTGGMMEATKAVGAVASPIASTIVSTGLALGALFIGFKGFQMVVTGKNSFKNSSIA